LDADAFFTASDFLAPSAGFFVAFGFFSVDLGAITKTQGLVVDGTKKGQRLRSGRVMFLVMFENSIMPDRRPRVCLSFQSGLGRRTLTLQIDRITTRNCCIVQFEGQIGRTSSGAASLHQVEAVALGVLLCGKERGEGR
jgi:hypothetical protein